MNRTALAAFAALAIMMIAAAGAEAKTNYGPCTDCHNADSAVNLTAADQGCTGSNARYGLSISTPHDWKEAWAVFNAAGTNIANGSRFPATVSLAEGQTYTIYGVTNKPGQKGTDTITVTPSCGPACTDGDGDGYFAEAGCTGPTDCDDGDGSINPGAAEVCGDGMDNNCGGGIDEGCVTCTDGDKDGYFAEAGCADLTDCDDGDGSINPGAAEVCGDGMDNNCGGGIDEGCVTCTDGDKDGYFAEAGCGDLTDCDDGDGSINPGAAEICGDGMDNNCGGGIDEGCVTCTDGDGDGYFAEAGCANLTDCDDGDGSINPGAAEVCGDGMDNNCGGGVDEGCISEPAGDTILDIIDEFGAVIASETAGECGKTTFYNIPAGTYFLELTRGETHFGKIKFIVPEKKSPARVIARAETRDEDDEASLKVKVDIYPMDDSEKLSVKRLSGSIEWNLQWAGSDEDFVITIVGDGVANLDRVTLETAHGSLNAYRIRVEDKRHRAEALFKRADLIGTLVPAGAQGGDRLRGKLHLVTPANKKAYRFRAKLED